MYPDKATIEIFRDGHWCAAGVLQPQDFRQGYRGSSRFEYLLDYALDNASGLLAPAAGLGWMTTSSSTGPVPSTNTPVSYWRLEVLSCPGN